MKEFLIGAAAIVLAGAALAQAPVAQPAPVPQAAPMPPMGFDRVQTRDEVVAKVREHFAQLDKNRDGSLTKEEADAGRAAMKDHFRQGLGERIAPRSFFHSKSLAIRCTVEKHRAPVNQELQGAVGGVNAICILVEHAAQSSNPTADQRLKGRWELHH